MEILDNIMNMNFDVKITGPKYFSFSESGISQLGYRKEIVHRIRDQIANKHVVLCLGDSMVHGDDLADHLYFKDFENKLWYPESERLLIPENEIRKIQEIVKNNKLPFEIWLDRWKEERRRSWTNKLQNLRPDLVIINIAESGASQDKITRKMLSWLALIKKLEVVKKIDIILGVTLPGRIELYKDGQYVSCFSGTIEHMTKYPVMQEYYLDYLDDGFLIDNYILNLENSLALAKAYDAEIKFLVYNDDYRTQRLNSFLGENQKIEIEKYLSFLSNLPESKVFSYVHESQKLPPSVPIKSLFRHFSEAVHDLLAKKFAEIL